MRKNSVTTSKIKKNAVTSAKVKAHTLTGSDINLKKLGTVPNATHASSADSIPQAEATHVIGASGEPAFENGATNSAAMLSTLTLPRAGFYKDAFGVVHLEGVVKAGGIPIIFTLPAGYRPAGGTAQIFEQSKEAPVIILGSAVTGAGAGAVIAGAENVILDGITYRAGG